jgi:hypothetical protein
MSLVTRVRYLRIALTLVGLIFLSVCTPLMNAWWPSGWRWQPYKITGEAGLGTLHSR